MKKVLTVLAVLVLLTGVVFAAETHKIKVKSDVGEQLPVFQLVYGSAITSSAAGIYTGNAGPYSDDTGIDVDFDLNENGSFIATAMINIIKRTNLKPKYFAIFCLFIEINPLEKF